MFAERRKTTAKLRLAIEQSLEREIVIARNGRPAAKLVPMDSAPAGMRIGVAKGLFVVPDTIDANNHEVSQLFMGGVSA